ncbi:MAG: glycosyltransferase family 2 protein [Alphaproteobacteria bacterium]|nr:glycosyltransferase family 2 protein [Alphaproteobacteria bacterium]
MTAKLPISVFIIAKNEADRIPYTIKSVVDWVDEVHVIDSGSEDDTMQISTELGAKAVYNPWPGYGPQKNFGESLCRNKWLINLDADEEITPELRDQIRALFAQSEPPLKAYSFTRKLMHFIEKSGTYGHTDHPIRLYHSDCAGFKDSTVHDSVTWKGEKQHVGLLSGLLLHRCFRSYKHMVDKINFYSTMQSEDMFRRGRRPSSLRLVIEPFFSFFKALFIRGYILRGVTGFVESILYAFARTLRLAKTRALYIAAERANKTPL